MNVKHQYEEKRIEKEYKLQEWIRWINAKKNVEIEKEEKEWIWRIYFKKATKNKCKTYI